MDSSHAKEKCNPSEKAVENQGEVSLREDQWNDEH